MTDLDFRVEIEKLLVDDNYWSCYEWMNNATGNDIIVNELVKRIKKHPLLWKWFFKIR